VKDLPNETLLDVQLYPFRNGNRMKPVGQEFGNSLRHYLCSYFVDILIFYANL